MAEHQVNSPMTGQIIEIPVGVGESVSEGDLLIVIESRKKIRMSANKIY